MESEMNAIIADLSAAGGPGISGSLVDAEGFPRSDIDIPAVRSKRARLAVLRNDHRSITAKIDETIQILHSLKLPRREQQAPLFAVPSASVHGCSSQATSTDMDTIAKIPFAMVDEISDASPAAEDGLQLGDQIIRFGNVEVGEALIQCLALEAQSNEGHPISVVVMRQGTPMNLSITPRQWHGRGLLGCHFRIL
ncbi:hypothetical protein HPP92_015427 [Vanilla planifolia]|uniref:PDZ domain-containing protein n=1 Tax=Vanilla planifolia TaxID=51239 RepID=A0A835QMA6_VANPL|nr:hypothetical protein HPP92_016035 [Vanilla planifolia]KAG0475741.1 hypothetical protein HPP92_015427 [Vanilla planifolia]